MRMFLLTGLLFHKLLWELLRRHQATGGASGVTPNSRSARLVKGLKVTALGGLVCQTLVPRSFLPIRRRPARLKRVGAGLFLIGLLTAVVGRLQLGDNWANIEDCQVKPAQTIVSTGLYRFIRHPIYVGDALLFVGLEIALNSWLVVASLVLVAVIVKQAVAEEALLARTIPAYKAYLERTKRFIPYVL